MGYALIGVITDKIGPSQVFLMASGANVVLAGIALVVPDIRKLQ